MQMRTLVTAALSVALAAATCSIQAQTSVQGLADRWTRAYNTHDREAIAALYTEGARLMVHGSPTVERREWIEDFWAQDFQAGDPLTLLSVTNSVSGSDMMLVHGDYRVIDRQNGSQLGFGRFAHLWKRDGLEWRLDRDLWNQPYEPYDVTSAATDVQALANRWVEAYNNHDRQALAAVYADDAALMMHGAPTIDGRRAIGDFWAQDFEAGNPLTLLTVTHAVDGIDMILVHGDYEVVNREDGTEVGFGRFAHIWFEDDAGNWRLDRDLWVERPVPYEFD